MRSHLFTTLLFAVASTAYSQPSGASIAGSVNDPQGKAIPGASVSLFARDAGWQTGTTADSSGMYRFDRLAPGDYLLRATAAGFAGAAQKIHLESGATFTANLSLNLQSLQEQVVVTASTTPQTPDEVSRSTSVLTAQQIDQRDEYALSEALRTEAGLRVQQEGGPLQFTSLRFFGLPEQDTAILIDGLRFRDSASIQADATAFVEDMLATDLDRIEIVEGPGSSLYGTNAIGGVINIVTDPGGGRTRGNLLLEGGSLGTFRGRAQFAGGWLDNRIEYSAGLTHLNVINGVDNDTPGHNTSEQGRISFRLSPTTQFILRAYAAESLIRLTGSPLETGNLPPTDVVPAIPNVTFTPAPGDPDSTRGAHFFAGALSLRGQPTRRLDYAISYQGLDTHRSYGDGPAGIGFQPPGSEWSIYNGLIQTLNAHLNYRLPHNLVTAGYEFENENFANSSLAAFDPASNSSVNVTERSHTAYAQDQLRLLDDRLQFSLAGRAQYFSLEQPQFTPAASAPYQHMTFGAPPAAYTGDASAAYAFRQSHTKFRAHVGRGYRAPSLYERFGTGYDEFFGYSVYGDPLLRPERSIGIDGGIDQDWLNGRLHASASYFYYRLQETIIFDTSGIDPATDAFGRFLGYANSHGGLARGVTATARWSAEHGFGLMAAYTFTDSVEKTPIVPDVWQTFVTPPQQFSIVAIQRLGRRFLASFDFTASGNYIDEVFGTVDRAYRFNGIRKADLALSYRLPLSEFRAVRFFAKGSNLLNQNYYESGFPTPGITGMGGVQFEF